MADLELTPPAALGSGVANSPTILLYPVVELLDGNGVKVSTILFEDLYPGRESQAQTIQVVNHNPSVDLDVDISTLIGALGSELDTVSSTLLSSDETSYNLSTLTLTALAGDTTPFYVKYHPPSTAKIGEKSWSLHLDIEGYDPPALSGWGYYGKLPVYGSVDGVLTDYQVEKRIYYHPGMNSDWSDLRFYLSDGTKLDYGIIGYAAGDYVDVGIKVPSIPASPGSVDIYVFCGNSSAVTDNDPNNTYLFFDDATGVYSDKWSVNGEYAVYSGRNTLKITTGDNIKASGFTLNRPFDYKFDFLMSAGSNLFVEYFLGAGEGLYDKYHILLNDDGTYYIRKNYGGLKSGYYSYITGWNTFHMTLNSSGVHNFYLNNDPVVTVTDTTYSSGLIGFDIWSFYSQQTYISNLRISKYTANPPVVGGFEGWNLTTDISLKAKILYQTQDLPGYTPVIRYGCRVGGVLYE